MVDEEKSEVVQDGEAKKKPAGRPRKSADPKPEPVAEQSDVKSDEPKDASTENGEEESATEEKSTPEVDDDSVAPEGRVIPEGEEVEISTREENGIRVATENTYLKKQLPKSRRFTYILLAVKDAEVK